MAVSGSVNFKSVAGEIIADALSLLGVLAEEEPLPAYDLVRGMRFLTKMLNHWEGMGIGGWLLSEGSISLVGGTGSYVTGSADFINVPFEITDARFVRSSSSSLPMTRLTRQQYYALPNRISQGTPTQFYYDRQRDAGTVYLWPVPDLGGTAFQFTYRRRIMDIDTQADNVDLPPEWEKAITDNLAYELINIYGKAGSPEAAKITKDAPVSFAIIRNWDVGEEEGTMSIMPDYGL